VILGEFWERIIGGVIGRILGVGGSCRGVLGMEVVCELTFLGFEIKFRF